MWSRHGALTPCVPRSLLAHYAVRKTSPLGFKLVPRGDGGGGGGQGKKRVWELRAANAAELEAWVHTLSLEAEKQAAAMSCNELQ